MDKYNSRLLESRSWFTIPIKPKTKMSKGEYLTYSFLVKQNINFVHQYRHKTLKHKKSLAIDFFVIYNGKKIAIEFNGRQHYFQVSRFEDVAIIQARDYSKSVWCKNNGVHLIILKYDQIKQIDQILSNYFC